VPIARGQSHPVKGNSIEKRIAEENDEGHRLRFQSQQTEPQYQGNGAFDQILAYGLNVLFTRLSGYGL